MSGGSLDYAFGRVDDAAATIEGRCRDPLHMAFVAHLQKVAVALRACEWMLSGDTGKGDDEEAIRAVLHPGDELAAAIRAAEQARDDLNAVLSLVKAQEPAAWTRWIAPVESETYRFACRDCGLVHDMEFRTADDGGVDFRVRRNERSTGQMRRHMKRRGELVIREREARR